MSATKLMHDGLRGCRLLDYHNSLITLARHLCVTMNRETEYMLRIDIQSSNGVATLYCSGRVVFGVEAEMLRTMVMSRPERRVQVDLARVEQIDASGLGLLLRLQAWAEDSGRGLKLFDPSKHVWRLVILTRLYGSLKISYSDVEEIPEEMDDLDRRQMIA